MTSFYFRLWVLVHRASFKKIGSYQFLPLPLTYLALAKFLCLESKFPHMSVGVSIIPLSSALKIGHLFKSIALSSWAQADHILLYGLLCIWGSCLWKLLVFISKAIQIGMMLLFCVCVCLTPYTDSRWCPQMSQPESIVFPPANSSWPQRDKVEFLLQSKPLFHQKKGGRRPFDYVL